MIPTRLLTIPFLVTAIGRRADPLDDVAERYALARKRPAPPTLPAEGLCLPTGPLRIGVSFAGPLPVDITIHDPMTDAQETRTFATWEEAQAWVDDRQARLLSRAIAVRIGPPPPTEPDPTPEQWLRDYLPQPDRRVARKVMLPRDDEPHVVAAQAAALAVPPHETRAQRRERLRRAGKG